MCDLDTLHKWCVNVGKKLIDEKIDPDQVLKGTLEPVPIPSRPNTVPIAIEWPESVYDSKVQYRLLLEDGTDIEFDDVELRLKNASQTGPLVFEYLPRLPLLVSLSTSSRKPGVPTTPSLRRTKERS